MGKLVVSVDYTPFIWIINAFQRDVLLVLKETVEFWSKSVEAQFGQDELNVGSD